MYPPRDDHAICINEIKACTSICAQFFSATSCILKYVFYPECPNSMAVVGRYCRTSLMGLRSVLLKTIAAYLFARFLLPLL